MTTRTWAFDPNKATKKQEQTAGKHGYEASKNVLIADFKATEAQIMAQSAKAIDENSYDDNAVRNIKDQEKQFIKEEKEKLNMNLAILAKRYNRTAEVLDDSEGTGKKFAKKVATVKQTRLGRFFKGAVEGFKEEFGKK